MNPFRVFFGGVVLLSLFMWLMSHPVFAHMPAQKHNGHRYQPILHLMLDAGPHREGRGHCGGSARRHTIIQSSGALNTVVADTPPKASSRYSMVELSQQRVISANGMPRHYTGRFPNSGNPHAIREQRYSFSMPANPSPNPDGGTAVWGYSFGIAVNGVPLDPAAAEWYLGNCQLAWQYEALSGAIPLGLDEHYAHVQPTGAYHYHGLPTGLLVNQQVKPAEHSPIIGWSADGYPVYALYGYLDPTGKSSQIVEMLSSFRLRSDARPAGGQQPGGTYDGTFVKDYVTASQFGSLDECNGRYTVTPEFPAGTYAYFLTAEWPVIPRCFKGTPDSSFRKGMT